MSYDFNGSEHVAAPDKTISLDWFSAASTEEFTQDYRIASDVPSGTVENFLTTAYIAVCRDLLDWKQKQVEAGHASLAAVPGLGTIEGKSEKEHLFLRAVYCTAKAELLREHLTMTRKPAAENLARSNEEAEADYHQLAADAKRLLMDELTCGVELI